MTIADPETLFSEKHVDADGFRIRYREAGKGEIVVCLHGAGGLRLSFLHTLLTEQFRVIAFEAPGFGASPANERSQSMQDLARTMHAAVAALGIERFTLMGTSFGGKLALWMAALNHAPLHAVVLLSPAAILLREITRGATPEAAAAMLYAHPERVPARQRGGPEIEAKQQALVKRLIGPLRDAELEARMPGIASPVLVMFGASDRMIPPDVAPVYRQLLPNCHNVIVYDAAHAIDADRPEAVAEVAIDFIQRREQFLVRRDTHSMIHP